MSPGRRGRLLVLGALCVVPPVVEVVALWLTGQAADRALATQATAPAPWGQFQDLRWLLVFHDSWVTFGLEAVALVALRGLLDASVVRAGWPIDEVSLPVPPWGPLLRRTAMATPVIWLFLVPWTVLGFGMDVVSISWLFFTTVPPVLVVALACSLTPGAPGWWRRVPPRSAVSTSVLVFVGQTLASLVMLSCPAALWLPAAAASGLGNAWAWQRLLRAVANPPSADGRRRLVVPFAPLVSVGMVVVAVSGAAIAFAVVGARRPTGAASPAGTGGTAGTSGSGLPGTGGPAGGGPTAPVLVVSGFDSKIDATTPPPPVGGGSSVRFSYRGADPQGRPEPYRASDTHQSLAALVRLMSAQVQSLHRRSGQPVTIVAESEGSLVTEVYLAADPRAPVSRAVLLSPLDQPARVYYPPSGREGFGVATGVALSWLTQTLASVSPVRLPAEGPFLRSIVDHAPALRGLLSCPPRTQVDLLEPLADSLADPQPPPPRLPAGVVAAFHGGLLTNPQAQGDVGRLLAGRPVRSGTAMEWAETVLRRASAGWQVPSLPLALYTASPDHPSCSTVTAAIRQWVGPLG